jgi:hypothetical protein
VIDGERRSWSLSWRRRLFQWEEEGVAHLMNLLDAAVFYLEEDRWSWLPESDEVFSVKFSYKLLSEEIRMEVEVEEALVGVFGQIWDSSTPSKLIAFSWQLLYNQIPSRNNLELRGIHVSDKPWECVGCV